MKPAFLNTPEAWTRASRGSMSAAEYGSPITIYGRRASRGDKAVVLVALLALAALVVLLAAERLA